MRLSKHDYSVQQVPHALAAAFIRSQHYTGSAPKTSSYAFGLFDAEGDLVGAALFMVPASQRAAAVAARYYTDDPQAWRRVLALSRLAVAPEVPPNGASFLLGRAIRVIRRDPRWDYLVTFADEGEGHLGGIYYATNWTFRGYSDPTWRWVRPDGSIGAIKATRTRTHAEMYALGYRREGPYRKLRFTYAL